MLWFSRYGMASRGRALLLVCLFLICLLPQSATEEITIVPQFGTAFEEILIADSSDDLNDPRDLEFHPGNNNQLSSTLVTNLLLSYVSRFPTLHSEHFFVRNAQPSLLCK